ncbi:MAG: hypothetical protein H6922_04295 [Pseudomonadaceae bacterium]|nr:hypothetical protein [Pseudomonadaceae bacterium]
MPHTACLTRLVALISLTLLVGCLWQMVAMHHSDTRPAARFGDVGQPGMVALLKTNGRETV